jgi:hypothetical protein
MAVLATSALVICQGTPTAARPTTSGGPARQAARTSISVPIVIADSILNVHSGVTGQTDSDAHESSDAVH